MNRTHDLVHPAHITGNENRLIGHVLSIGEQIIDLIDSICTRMLQEALLHGAKALAVANDRVHCVMAQSIGILIGLGLKYIVFHSVVSSFRIVFRIFFVVCVFNGLRNHRVNNSFLFFRKRVEYVCDGFLFFLALVGLFLLIRSVRSIF